VTDEPINDSASGEPIGGPIARQCAGHISSGPEAGRRCRRSARRGTTVCDAHGGAAAQVKLAAARREAEAEAVAAFERYGGANGNGGRVNIAAELDERALEAHERARFAAQVTGEEAARCVQAILADLDLSDAQRALVPVVVPMRFCELAAALGGGAC
jgi:hypothetical protein